MQLGQLKNTRMVIMMGNMEAGMQIIYGDVSLEGQLLENNLSMRHSGLPGC